MRLKFYAKLAIMDGSCKPETISSCR